VLSQLEEKKAILMLNITAEQGAHLLKTLPEKMEELLVSSAFFDTLRINDTFLKLPVEKRKEIPD